MTITEVRHENGSVTKKIVLSIDENDALEKAHSIVSSRYQALGITQSAWEKEHLEYSLLGILRFEGISNMLTWAKTAKITSGKHQLARGYKKNSSFLHFGQL